MTDQLSGGVVQPTDAQILALNAGEQYFSESPSRYPEAGFGTQYHTGAPGVIGFARAVLALAVPQAPLQAEPVPVVASEPVAWMRAGANPWHGWEACAEGDPNGFPVYRATPQAEPAVAEQARDAARYRLLRQHGEVRVTLRGGANEFGEPIDVTLMQQIPSELDAALDRALASQSTPPAPLLGYEQTIDKAKACGARVTQHEIGFTHAEFAQFIASTPPPESAVLADEYRKGYIDGQIEMRADLATPPENAAQGLSDAVKLLRNAAAERFRTSSSPGYKLHDLYRSELDAILAANPTAQPDGGSKA